MKKIVLTVLTAAFAALLPMSALAQGSSGHESGTYPITFEQFVPCAINGVGEVISISGTLYYQVNYTLDGSGGMHFEEIDKPQNSVTGVGLSSGIRYEAIGGAGKFEENIASTGLPYETTFVIERPWIGERSAENIFFRLMERVTIDTNGKVHAEISKMSFMCR